VPISDLFKPFVLKGLTIPNRIVMAPMTRNRSPEHIPGPDVAAYYRRRAEDGVGLIITEGTIVDHPAAGGAPQTPHISGEGPIAGWKQVVGEVRSASGHIMSQLWNLGANANPDFLSGKVQRMSPSGLRKPGEKVGEPMTQADIDAAIDAYAQGAQTAQRIGFHGIELHGAHGYLIDQFFWSGTNLRADKYGGDIKARTRFAVETIQECRRRTSPDFPILLRFSQWKVQDYTAPIATTPQELEQFLAPLTASGVDAFDVSTRRFWEPAFEGRDLNLAGWTKKLSGKPVIAIGSITLDQDFVSMRFGAPADAHVPGIELVCEMLARGEFDLVAVGRALLADPNWTSKVRAGRIGELRPYSREVEKDLY
jgi:2,4-dienoyl-CoA reductase-like NADH-dependent reductase (Old Yellow Enzyme family)